MCHRRSGPGPPKPFPHHFSPLQNPLLSLLPKCVAFPHPCIPTLSLVSPTFRAVIDTNPYLFSSAVARDPQYSLRSYTLNQFLLTRHCLLKCVALSQTYCYMTITISNKRLALYTLLGAAALIGFFAGVIYATYSNKPTPTTRTYRVKQVLPFPYNTRVTPVELVQLDSNYYTNDTIRVDNRLLTILSPTN